MIDLVLVIYLHVFLVLDHHLTDTDLYQEEEHSVEQPQPAVLIPARRLSVADRDARNVRPLKYRLLYYF